MAGSQESINPLELKMQLKQAAREEKMRKKQAKREAKMRKLEVKRRRKEEKLRAKLAAKGIKLPPKKEEEIKPTGISGEEKLPEAEIITGEADVWTPRSARNLDEIQKRIDRMDKRHITSLKERYKSRYGEDLEVPDIYNVESTIEIETAEKAGEIEKVETDTKGLDTTPMTSKPDEKKRGLGLFGSKVPSTEKDKEKEKDVEKIKTERPLRLLDYRTPFYLRDKYAVDAGSGKRTGLLIIDIILNILLTIFIIKIITTIIYVIKDRREEKIIKSLSDQSTKPQPST